jgi:uncharacterized membrane protein YoaT (DUF817 family)
VVQAATATMIQAVMPVLARQLSPMIIPAVTLAAIAPVLMAVNGIIRVAHMHVVRLIMHFVMVSAAMENLRRAVPVTVAVHPAGAAMEFVKAVRTPPGARLTVEAVG